MGRKGLTYVSETFISNGRNLVLKLEQVNIKEKTTVFKNPIKVQVLKVFKNGASKICGRQPLKNLKWYGLPKQTISLQIF